MTNDKTSLARLQFDSPASDIAVLLQSHPLFAETDLAALTKLLSCGQMLTLRPGDVLIRQGEASDSAYIIIEGSGAILIETHAKCRSLSRDVFSKLTNIHALKIPWFTHLLAINNQAGHLRLAQRGRNGCGRLIDLGRKLAGFLQLVEQRHNCYFSTGDVKDIPQVGPLQWG